MKIVKWLSPTLIIAVLFLSFNVSVYAESESYPEVSMNLGSMTKVELSQSELEQIFEHMIWQDSSESQVSELHENNFSVNALRVFFEYSGLEKSEIFQSSGTISVPDSDYGRIVTTTVVQWADSLSIIRSPQVLYMLISKDFQKDHYVTGRYTSENTSFDFRGIPEGEYYIWVQNVNSYDISGNGFADLSSLPYP
ncbi:hypothetical protein J41TS12_03630 [Paenibacillus antibioticophila]|uniref:Uncharacterized protein n=1 Tax=Paenibacillus antibioticophila TaxID=1274374 RepID=A0A920CGB0_9BACL|nr:hypothetical protein [Paenibacillus antibioticophila]GIO35502.1 hypothetical protein J41TS12_03630 [Paenibacillus antibioticophila]